ncbi:MAG: flavodoxin family protein [Bacteroidales bacterium]|nr:flavodoxin family protein [Bacteroidales bacterium]MCL2739273.1 flavodoxin family protein [Bacteroidales bacterium]
MNVLLINGSPHIHGCTYTALMEVAGALEENGIGTRIFHLGSQPISGCLGCVKCAQTGLCFMDDVVNEFLEISGNYDGFVFGSPVHYASASGMISSFMDRVFYCKNRRFALKPAAAIVSCRRGGASAAVDRLNKYFTISNMPIVSSQYWNMVHGNTPDEVRQDLEGMQIMRTLGRNMAWLLHCIDAGKKADVPLPATEKRIVTNFIR